MLKRAADLDPNNALISVPVKPYLFFLEVANSVNSPNQPYCDKLVTLKQTTGQKKQHSCPIAPSLELFSRTTLNDMLILNTQE